jgi:hypothetical protein
VIDAIEDDDEFIVQFVPEPKVYRRSAGSICWIEVVDAAERTYLIEAARKIQDHRSNN